ncbi:cytochrome P450 [Xylaria sp. FL0043]|nr:cytochrome P450 [Xylaria sp. FL0043]
MAPCAKLRDFRSLPEKQIGDKSEAFEMLLFIILFLAIVPPISYSLLALLNKLLVHPTTFPKCFPVVGPRKQILSVVRASLRQITRGIQTLLDGYSKHGQRGKPFVVYDPSGQQELLVPAEYVKWLCSQLDSNLSDHGVLQERHAAKYLDKDVELSTSRQFLERLIGDRLNRHLDKLQPLLHEEFQKHIDEVYGKDEEEWKELNVYRGFEDIVIPTVSRVLLGLQLSRDPQVFIPFRRYSLLLGLLFVGEVPHVLKQQQLALGTDNRSDAGEASFIWHAAKHSEKSIVSGVGTASKPEVIAEWVMLLGMAGTHTTIFQGANLLLNIANCAKEWRVVERLREEAQETLTGDADWADASGFKRQVLANSVIRETLRLNPVTIKGLTKEVMPSSGFQLPDGTSMPKGGWAISHGHDPDAAKPSTTYLTFGYGRSSCPGRRFAVLMLKKMMAYIILNYDIESTGPIPPTRAIGDAALPPRSSTIRIRRRKQARE